MFLSKVIVDWKWARDPYQIHRALWQLFPDRPDSQRDFLFRAEGGNSQFGLSVLLQSETEPQSVQAASIVASKPLELQLSAGMRMHFRVRANPVKTIKDGQGRLNARGEIKSCRVPLIKDEECLQWLVRKFEHAARLESARMQKEPTLLFQKKGMKGKIQTLCYEGTLAVTSPDEFRVLLRTGIGPAKSMGCGLISLARA